MVAIPRIQNAFHSVLYLLDALLPTERVVIEIVVSVVVGDVLSLPIPEVLMDVEVFCWRVYVLISFLFLDI